MRLPLHTIRSLFDIPHVHLNDLALVEHGHKPGLFHFTFQCEQRPRRKRQEHGCHSRLVANCEKWFQNAVRHGKEL